MSKPKSFRACFVPLCTNTTETTPDKVFLNVPLEIKRRNEWFKAVGRVNSETRTRLSCCEDHFDVKEDINNYLYYRTMGGRVRIKINVVPHKFSCHSTCNLKPNRRTLSNLKRNYKKQANAIPSPAVEKRRKQQITQVKKINCKEKFTNVEEPFTSLENKTENQENINVVCSTSTNKDETNRGESVQALAVHTKEAILLPEKIIEDNIDCQQCDSIESVIKPKPHIIDVRTISLSSFNAIEEVLAFPSNNRQLSTDYDIEQNENQIIQFPGNIICLNCPKISTYVCEVCLQAYYCSKECAASYWVEKHYKYCRPHHIKVSKGKA